MYYVKDMLTISEALSYEVCIAERDYDGMRFWERISRKRYGGAIVAVDALSARSLY